MDHGKLIRRNNEPIVGVDKEYKHTTYDAGKASIPYQIVDTR